MSLSSASHPRVLIDGKSHRRIYVGSTQKEDTPINDYLESKVEAPRTRAETHRLLDGGACLKARNTTPSAVRNYTNRDLKRKIAEVLGGEDDLESSTASEENAHDSGVCRTVDQLSSRQLRRYFLEVQKEQLEDLDGLFKEKTNKWSRTLYYNQPESFLCPEPPPKNVGQDPHDEANTFRGRGYRSPPKTGRVVGKLAAEQKMRFRAPTDQVPSDLADELDREYQTVALPRIRQSKQPLSARTLGMNISQSGELNGSLGGRGTGGGSSAMAAESIHAQGTLHTVGTNSGGEHFLGKNLKIVALQEANLASLVIDSDTAAGLNQLYGGGGKSPRNGDTTKGGVQSIQTTIFEAKKVTPFEIRRFQQRQDVLKSGAVALHKKKKLVRSAHYPPHRSVDSPPKSKAMRPAPSSIEAWKLSCGLINTDREEIYENRLTEEK